MSRNKHKAQAQVQEEVRSLIRFAPIISKFERFVDRAVVPLMNLTLNQGVPEAIGSGVLLKSEEHVFLLTAAHALEHFDGREIYIPIRGIVTGITGKSYRTKRPASGTHFDDAIDAAVLHIDPGPERDGLRSRALPAEHMYMQRRFWKVGL